MTAITPTVDDPIYRRRWYTLAVLALSLVIIGLDNSRRCSAPSTPPRQSSSGWSIRTYSSLPASC